MKRHFFLNDILYCLGIGNVSILEHMKYTEQENGYYTFDRQLPIYRTDCSVI